MFSQTNLLLLLFLHNLLFKAGLVDKTDLLNWQISKDWKAVISGVSRISQRGREFLREVWKPIILQSFFPKTAWQWKNSTERGRASVALGSTTGHVYGTCLDIKNFKKSETNSSAPSMTCAPTYVTTRQVRAKTTFSSLSTGTFDFWQVETLF